MNKNRLKVLFGQLKGLETLLSDCGSSANAIDVYYFLHRLEQEQTVANIRYSYDLLSTKDYTKGTNKRQDKILRIFNNKISGLFINSDPQGYALKLKGNQYGKYGLYMDLCGYYILAPDLN